MTVNFESSYGVPGITALQEASESDLYWSGDFNNVLLNGQVIDGASRDVGNTGKTTLLRAGLLMGRVRATKKLKEWSPNATDGTETIHGLLLTDVNTQRLNANEDRFYGFIMVGGPVKIERLIVPGTAAIGISGNALEYLILAQLQNRFAFTEIDLASESYTTLNGYKNIIAKTANYTVLLADNETLFTNKGAAGAVTFTLPTTAIEGLHYGFFVAADNNLIVAGGTADTLIVFNDAAADSIAFQTASEKLGGMFEVFGDGALWMVKVSLGAETQTPTIVT